MHKRFHGRWLEWGESDLALPKVKGPTPQSAGSATRDGAALGFQIPKRSLVKALVRVQTDEFVLSGFGRAEPFKYGNPATYSLAVR